MNIHQKFAFIPDQISINIAAQLEIGKLFEGYIELYMPYIYSLMLFNRPKLFHLLMQQFWYRDVLLQWYRSINGKKASVIELGCGPGEFLMRIAQPGVSLTGVDSSEDMLRFFRRKHPSAPVTLRRGDALSSDCFAGQQYDLILAASLINVVRDKRRLLANCIDHTSTNGSVSFFFPTESMSRSNAERYAKTHDLPSLSQDLLTTWATNARKLGAEQILSLLPSSIANTAQVNFYLDEMACSLTFSVH